MLRRLMVKPSGLSDWKAMQPILRPLVEENIIIGFNLGDELVYFNISWASLNEAAAAVKELFPEAFVLYNNGGAPHEY